MPFPPLTNKYEATALLNDLLRRSGSSTSSSSSAQTSHLNAEFNISMRYCTPTNAGAQSKTIQFLTHGLGFDMDYWDFQLPGLNAGNYSYTDSALAAGYSTLAWDRLGCGNSTIADPYTQVQTAVELAILNELTTLLRQGKLDSCVPVPSKVIHVGHSYGSVLTNALVATKPTLSDAVVLTGYSQTATYQPLFLASTNFHIAALDQPKRFGGYSTGLSDLGRGAE